MKAVMSRGPGIVKKMKLQDNTRLPRENFPHPALSPQGRGLKVRGKILCKSGEICGYKRLNSSGFTLVELLVAIAISVFIAAAIYWSVVTALQSWGYMKDELLLQKVASQTMQELIEGSPDGYGLRDALEVVSASEDEAEVVFPWTDATHIAQSGMKVYTLNKQIKPGTGIPIAEARLPEAETYRSIPITVLDWGRKEELDKVELPLDIASGSQLRFTYHADPKKNPDIISGFKWIEEEGQIYLEDNSGRRNISKNLFGIKITKFSFRYYDNANDELSDGGDVGEDDLQFIAGIEIFLEASLKDKKKELLSFVNLRNSPARGGSVVLKEGVEMPIPDSKRIKTLFLTNLRGIDNKDVLQLEADPSSGTSWRVTINFSRDGLSVPMVESYVIEYPAGNVILNEKPRTSVELGLNLLSLGTNGLQDYDDDEDIEDFVLLEGDVELKVTKMDIAGAALFVR